MKQMCLFEPESCFSLFKRKILTQGPLPSFSTELSNTSHGFRVCSVVVEIAQLFSLANCVPYAVFTFVFYLTF